MAPALTLNDCLPYQCGADAGNEAMIMSCQANGFNQSRSCYDPLCAPYCPPKQSSPRGHSVSKVSTRSVHRSMHGIGQTPSDPAILTPQNLASPLPDVTQALSPQSIVVSCSGWDTLNGSIQDNPVIAALVLGLAFYVLWPKQGKR
jgi:hypothetical protein